MKTLAIVIIVFFSSTLSHAMTSPVCDFHVIKSVVPRMDDGASCLQDYFAGHNLAQFSLSFQTGTPIYDSVTMQFDDMLLFTLPHTNPLGESGRTALVEEIFQAYQSSLRDMMGACTANIYSGDKLLSLKDFSKHKREEGGQPGTRLMIKSEDISSPHWELLCQDAAGKPVLAKEGNYFFIFVDVYENLALSDHKATPKYVGHLAKYLFSYR